MRDLHIATGASFFDAPSNQSFSWPSIVNLLSQYDIGTETLDQYNALSKNEQLRRKDRGWFNGNTYLRADRQTEYITGVDLLCLDIDNGPPNIGELILQQLDPIFGDDGFAHFVGSTRKHSVEKPRLRLVIPTSRTVTIDEADALKRMIAFRIGMRAFDQVTFRANQIMFWPSRCVDGAIYARIADGPWLAVDDCLARWYPNGWENRDSWPLHPTEERESLTHQRKKAGDPLEKQGMIGAWCRLYTIEEAMGKFLPGVYLSGSTDGRYTHSAGSTADGAIAYDNKWLYSHHQTDPGSGRLLNAWDLVRVHKFGALDAKASPNAQVHTLPSTKQMTAFAKLDGDFRHALGEDASLEFSKIEDIEQKAKVVDLAALLDFMPNGDAYASHDNLVRILRNHPGIAGALAYNHNTDTKTWLRFMPWHDSVRRSRRMDPVDGLPFTDIDLVRLREWLRQQYKMEQPSLTLLKECVALVADENGFHPIRDHVRALPLWDGRPRLDTLFVRYLNAEDTPYTRAAARTFCVGMIKRVMEPGCKFDTMLLLIGVQRIRKSAFLEALAGGTHWFSDELPTISGKEAVEHIRSLWLVEVAELAQFTKAEITLVKAFLTRKVDRARLVYEENSRFFPRQTVFAGTTNNFTPLKDTTGNGRFLPIICRGFVPQTVMIDVEGLLAERDQIMAEARAAWAANEPIHMTDVEAIIGARIAQDSAMPEDAMMQTVNSWLDGEIGSKRAPRNAPVQGFNDQPQFRYVTCVRQIACEALGYSDDGTDWPTWLAARILDHMHSQDEWGRPDGSTRLDGYGKPRVFRRVKGSVPPMKEPDPERAAQMLLDDL